MPKFFSLLFKSFFLLVAVFTVQMAMAQDASAVNKTWDGGGNDNNWSTCGNWNNDSCPGGGDVAIFDATSTKNVTIDSSFAGTISGINMNTGYTGIITQARSLSVTAGFAVNAGTFQGDGNSMSAADLTIAGGTYIQAGGSITVGTSNCNTNNFTITSGTFTGGSGPIAVTTTCSPAMVISGGSFTSTSGTLSAVDFAWTSGTVNPNNGTIELTGTGTTLSLPVGGGALYNLTINKNNAQAQTVLNGRALTVNGTLTLSNGRLSADTAISVKGNVTYGAGYDCITGSNVVFNVDGAGAQTIDYSNAVGVIEAFNLSNASASIVAHSSGTVSIVKLNVSNGTWNLGNANTVIIQGLYISGGTVNAGSGALNIADDSCGTNRDFSITGGSFVGGSGPITWNGNCGGHTFDISGSGSFTSTSGTLTIDYDVAITGGSFSANGGTMLIDGINTVVDVNSTITFNNLTLAKGNNNIAALGTNDTLVVQGTLTLTDGQTNVGSIDTKGTVSMASTWDGGTTALLMTGSANSTATLNSGNGGINLTLNNPNAIVNLNGAGTVNFASATLQQGTMNAGTTSAAYSGAVVLSGATYNAPTSGAAVTNFNGTFNESSGTFAGGTNTVNHAAYTLSGGTYNASTGNTNVSGSWTHTAGGTFNHNNGNMTAALNTGATWDFATSETFYNFTENVTTGWTLTIASGDTLIALNNLNFTNGVIATGTFEARGNVTVASTFDAGNTASLRFGGTADQNFDLTTYTNWNSPITVNKASGTVNLASILVSSGAFTFQSGTVNPGSFAVTIGGAYNQSGGTWMAGSNIFDLNNNFTLSAGTFNASSSTTSVSGTWTHTAGGTFNHNNSLVVADLGAHSTWDFATSETFYNFRLNGSSNWTWTIASGDTAIVTNTLDLVNGALSTGTLEARGNVTVGIGFDAGNTASFRFQNSTADQSFDLGSYTGWNTPLTIDKASGTVNLLSNFTTAGLINMVSGNFNPGANAVTIGGVFTQSGGTWMAGSNIFDLNNNFALSAGTFNATSNTMSVSGTWTHTAGGTFNHNNGTVLADLSGHLTWDVLNTETFYNFTENPISNWILTLGANDNFIVLNTLNLTNGGFNAGKLTAQGDVNLSNNFDSGTTTLTFSGGASTQNFNITAGASALFDGDITVNKNAGEVVVNTSALTLNAANQDLVVQAGTLDLNGQSLTVNGSTGTFVVQTGAALQLQGAETFTLNGGNPQLQSGSLVQYYGASGPYTIRAFAYDSLEIAGGNNTVFAMPGVLNIGGNLTLTSGIFSANGQNLTVTGVFSNLSTLRLQGNENVTLTPDIDSGTVEYVGNGNGTGQNFSMKNWTYYNLSVSMADAADSIDATSPLNVASAFKLTNGEFKAPNTFNLSGNFLRAGGTFTHNNGTVVMNGTNQSLSGSTTFNNFTKTVNSAATLTFPAGQTQVFAGLLTLNGASGQLLSLRSSSNDVQASIDPQGGRSLSFLDVKDSNNLNDTQTNCTSGCVNSLNNSNWLFVIPTILPSAISRNTNEAGQTATFTLVLATQPSDNVVVGLTSSDLTEGTVGVSSVTFTTNNWDTPQTITVTGVDDFIDDGDIVYSIITAASTSNDNNYNNINISDISATNVDNDTAGINVSTLSGNTTEAGGTGTFTVVLTAQPSSDTSIGISSSDTTEGTVSAPSLTFTSGNWSSPQTITVTGVDDFIDDGDIAYTVTTAPANSLDLAYNGLNPSDVSALNTDNDTAGVSLNKASVTTTEAGVNDTYTLTLTSQPASDVTIMLAPGSQATISQGSVTFTSGNWSTPQTLTVGAINDAYQEGVHTGSITHSTTSADGLYNNIAIASLTVNITDNDTAGVFIGGISGTVSEDGSSATFSVVLTSQPTADVSFGLESSDASEGTVAPSSLTFSNVNWNTPQIVTVTGLDDEQDDGSVNFSIQTHSITSVDSNYNGVNPADVTVTNTDNDSAAVIVTQSGGNTTVIEGGATDSYTIVLTSEPTGSVSIELEDDNQITGAPATLNFTLENWNQAQTVTVSAINDSIAEGAHGGLIVHTASSTDPVYDDLAVSSVSVTITDNDTAGITVSTISGHTTESGATATATLVLTSQPTSNVTVGLSSSDDTEGTVAPTFFVFTSDNWNAPQTLTATGINDDVDDEAVTYSVVTAPASSSDLNYNNRNPGDITVINDDNDTSGITVSVISGNTTEANGSATFTVVMLSEPTADVSIGLSSSDTTEGTVSPTSLTFTTVNWDIVQTVTVTGVNDSIVDGTVAYNILTEAAVSTDPDYSGLDVPNVSVSNTDNDSAGVSITPTSLSGTEGQSRQYSMLLNTQPSNDVMISISTDGHVTRSPLMLMFTSDNWNVAQLVTLTLTDDSNVENNEVGVVSHSSISSDTNYNSLNIATVTVSITDNDQAQEEEEEEEEPENNNSHGGSHGGGAGGGGSGNSNENDEEQSNDSQTEVDTTEEDIEAEELATELGEETPDHWSEGYLENLLDETYIIDVAVKVESFLEVLFDFFVAPDSGTNRGDALSFLLVQSGVDLSTITVNAMDPTFSDIDTLDDNFSQVEFAFQSGLISGYPDGTFQSDRVINRAEALKLVFSFYKEGVPTDIRGEELLAHYELSTNPFSDLDLNVWFAPYVIAAYHCGIIQGYQDGTFQGAREVSHAEFLKIATLVQNIDQTIELASELE